MNSRKSYPTAPNRPKKAPSAIDTGRKAKPEAPRIFVGVPSRWGGIDYRSAKLRNRRDYVYLQWRDAAGVHSFYLGKAPKSCPT